MQNNQPGRHSKIEKKAFPFYPLLFGIYPVLALAAFNISQIDLSLTYRVFAFSLILAGVLFLVMRLFMRSWARAALPTLLLLVLFFSYGHVYSFLKNPANPLYGLARHRILGLVWLVLAGLSLWFTTRKIANLASITQALNAMSVILLIFPVFQIGQFEVKNFTPVPAANSSGHPNPSQQASQSDPDIYYIILDGYMRADNIKAIYNFDNSAFIDALTQRGFYVASCSLSNYAYTELSLASSLNSNYLDTLGASNDNTAYSLIKNSSVRQFLKEHGYTIVAFETGFSWSQWEKADVYYKYAPHPFQLNGFETLFLQTTILRYPLDILNQKQTTPIDELNHDRTISNLNNLKKVPASIKGPKFVFAHLIIPHPPYVFSPNGDYAPVTRVTPKFIYDLTTKADDRPGYTNAIRFINSAMLKVVDSILSTSKIPPVIIIQGDHGAFRFTAPEERISILNAYYFPNPEAKAALYSTITPVNTFRILFTSYFGQNDPLLPDVSRYSLVDKHFAFTTVPNQCH